MSKIIKIDGTNKEYTLDDGTVVSFDKYEKTDYNTKKSKTDKANTLDEEILKEE